jgi:hypothetical protein
MPVEKGIILYSIELDGCLNGVYTNEDADGEIFNEVAIKKKNDEVNEDHLVGSYDCFYFENGNAGTTAILNVKKTAINMYDFKWTATSPQGASFTGIGYKMNEKQIAVRYED